MPPKSNLTSIHLYTKPIFLSEQQELAFKYKNEEVYNIDNISQIFVDLIHSYLLITFTMILACKK